jgi:large subunit ribosomal protein L25
MKELVLSAEPRSGRGTREAKRLRKTGRLPANVYGHGQENESISLDTKEFRRFFEEGHRVVTIQCGGKDELGVVKEVQYDALGSDLLHVDFTRISRDETISMEVPVAIIGVPKGLASGGVLDFPHKEVKIAGPAGSVPEHYELNVESLTVGDVIRAKDLAVPEGCEIVEDPEQVIVAITAAREEPGAEGTEEPSTDEPEVIGRKKEDEEEGSE